MDPAGFATLSDAEKRSIEQTIKQMVQNDNYYSMNDVLSFSLTNTTTNTFDVTNFENSSSRSAIETFNESVGKFINEESERDKGAKAAIACDIQNYRRYVSQFNAKFKPDILSASTFWKSYGQMFVILGKVAKKMLSVPATSVPSESCFSTASFLGRKERSRLTDENLSTSVFLKDKINF